MPTTVTDDRPLIVVGEWTRECLAIDVAGAIGRSGG